MATECILTCTLEERYWILIDFSLTVKAATSIFLPGHGSAI